MLPPFQESHDCNLCCSFIIWLDLLQTSDGGKIFEHFKDLLEMKSTLVEENTLILCHSFGYSLTQKVPNLQLWPSLVRGGGDLRAELQSKNRVYDSYFECANVCVCVCVCVCMCVCVCVHEREWNKDKERERKREKEKPGLNNKKGPTAPGQCEILLGELTEQIGPVGLIYERTYDRKVGVQSFQRKTWNLSIWMRAVAMIKSHVWSQLMYTSFFLAWS